MQVHPSGEGPLLNQFPFNLQVLHSDVADLSDKFLPLEPVFPLVSSHLERRRVLQGSWARTLRKLPRLEEKEEEEEEKRTMDTEGGKLIQKRAVSLFFVARTDGLID